MMYIKQPFCLADANHYLGSGVTYRSWGPGEHRRTPEILLIFDTKDISRAGTHPRLPVADTIDRQGITEGIFA